MAVGEGSASVGHVDGAVTADAPGHAGARSWTSRSESLIRAMAAGTLCDGVEDADEATRER